MSYFEECKRCERYEKLIRIISRTPEDLPDEHECFPCPVFATLQLAVNKDHQPQTEVLLSTDLIDDNLNISWPAFKPDKAKTLFKSPEQATIYALHKLGYTQREIAEYTHLSLGNVNAQLKQISIKITSYK